MGVLAIVLLLSFGLSYWFAAQRSPLRVLDAPNARSLHEHPVPKTGGLALLCSVLAGWLWLMLEYDVPPEFHWIWAAAFLVAVVSFIDDLKELSPLPRIFVHAIASALLIVSGLSIHDSLPGQIFTFMTILWMLNLYNFMDGMDGFAGGMTLCGFGFIGLAAFIHGDQLFALLAWTIAFASAGFLAKNFPPAKLFMGDTGSATLGLLAAAFSLWGIKLGVFDVWFPLLVFSPFVVDATVTLIRRIFRKERIWEAHREHYYQRLALAGWGHKQTVLVEYALMLAVGTSAMLMLYWPISIVAGLGFWALVYWLLTYKADQFCKKYSDKVA